MRKIMTQSPKETKKVATTLARDSVRRDSVRGDSKTVRVIALVGNLGTGKTTFAQGFARALGVKDNIVSPTFLIMRVYEITQGSMRHFVHIDCYRLESPGDLSHLGLEDILSDTDAIVLIEWADRIKKMLPKNTTWITFAHGAKEHERYLTINHRP